MQDKIQEIMGLVTQHAYIYYSAATGGCRDSDDFKESERAIESKLRELVRESLSMDGANKLWNDCLKKYKRPGPYELIVEFCNITNTSK